MIEDKEAALLADITRLRKKYGSSTFKSLAEFLSKPDFAEQVARVLNAMEVATPSKGQSKASPLATQLTGIRDSDPQKYELVRRFKEDLEMGDLLPTLKDMKRFATENGLDNISSESRAKAIPSLVRQL